MSERSEMMEWIRSEIMGPARPLKEPAIATFDANRVFTDNAAKRCGPLGWRPGPQTDTVEEVLYYDRECPHRKYGVGLLHPKAEGTAASAAAVSHDVLALQATDTVGAEIKEDEVETVAGNAFDDDEDADSEDSETSEDFEVTSPDVYHPSTIGISLCVRLNADGCVVIRLPRARRFSWQDEASPPFLLNGRYESCKHRWTDESGRAREEPMWRRLPAVLPDCEVVIAGSELRPGKTISRDPAMPQGSPIKLRVQVFPRLGQTDNSWLLTVVLRNLSAVPDAYESILYQSYFEVTAREGSIEKYPESQRPFDQLDAEEQSLALLYRESATWGIGHGCAAGWEAEPDKPPPIVFADVLPAVQLPSMTPDITDIHGNRLRLSMRTLASLPEEDDGPAWQSLDSLASEYEAWIERARQHVTDKWDTKFGPVATRHLDACAACLTRIKAGIALLRRNPRVRQAFRLANLAMLLQQIATKQLARRPLRLDAANPRNPRVRPQGSHQSPWDIYAAGKENESLGAWRAFQIAFLLMSLDGAASGHSPDREVVDLIWFPTGGGKTEAYLAVVAFYLFHERLLMADGNEEPKRDGTNVLMRYTLRMLTTQQFQRAASLICAMEFLRRNPARHGIATTIPGRRFSLGLWIGGDGSPNKIADAKKDLASYRKGDRGGNPLILTECPWCRAEIGRFDGEKPKKVSLKEPEWNTARTGGITEVDNEGPLLHCTDGSCSFGQEQCQHWLPIEVIDQRIYRLPPSLVIGTADKFAMIAYRPDAGAIFGRKIENNQVLQLVRPPGLIIQDELHLISGPLGTIYALYEGIFERLCSHQEDGNWIKPKLIASTATIRGAADQVKALYARQQTNLFPPPGLLMGDSFFGAYARDDKGRLREGRLYLGIHANDYGSVLTTQVRSFSAALFRPYAFAEDRRDPWWTLLAFYNSLRELGAAKTLFDSDIRSRLKFMFNREGYEHDNRRNLQIVEELTSRLSQSEIVGMMDRISAPYTAANRPQVIDACLASNIIEVGVDIDRLSLMGVVGQPKTTATYIQVTGRVGRRWWERAGLILILYSPAKSRDRSHFEQFHSYHRRLYERVEPTSATPFALSAIQRALPGALIAWARQQCDAPVGNAEAYAGPVEMAYQLLRERCQAVQATEDVQRSLDEINRVYKDLMHKWKQNPQAWENFPPEVQGEYLMLWPGQFATPAQRHRGVVVPSSMRQVDGSAELAIDQGYVSSATPATVSATAAPVHAAPPRLPSQPINIER